MKIFVLTDIPSPYQTEIFNEIAAHQACQLNVAYLRSADPQRRWSQPNIEHPATRLGSCSRGLKSAFSSLTSADVAVFNYYHHPVANFLITTRAQMKKPWCYWGERPGFRKPELMGRLLRHWKLRPLHSSAAPIWGIGNFAVNQYKAEFGPNREYFNLPYFSNLTRFQTTTESYVSSTAPRRFIYSGALIHRKGVDLLATAFKAVVSEGHNVTLRIVGDGPLRDSLRKSLAEVSNLVEFVGFKDWSELPAHYAECHILCAPSRYDGWGLVVPEGLASGLPVIATDQMGAALEFISSGSNGWLIKAGNQKALTDAMRTAAALREPELTLLSSGAKESVHLHTLQVGALRFVNYARSVVANWAD